MCIPVWFGRQSPHFRRQLTPFQSQALQVFNEFKPGSLGFWIMDYLLTYYKEPDGGGGIEAQPGRCLSGATRSCQGR